MDTKVDFLELAAYCKQEIEQKCAESNRKHHYEILYAAILEDESLRISTTPHILRDAKRCILIHSWRQLAATIYYDTYLVQFINEDGEVLQEKLDSEYSIHISPSSFNCSAIISLSRCSKMVYSAKLWSNGELLLPLRLRYVWDLYKKCKAECQSLKESQLLGRLAKANQNIEELNSQLADSSVNEELLKEEVRQYRSILDEIKNLVDSNK